MMLKRMGGSIERTKPNNGMHPTRDTLPFIISNDAGRRVMTGVRLLSSAQKKY